MAELIKTRRNMPIRDIRFLYSVQNGYEKYFTNNGAEVKFLKSGTLTVKNNVIVDVFLVGGGGGGGFSRSGGGGGGYTLTKKNIKLRSGEVYQIVIGKGGSGSRSLDKSGETGGTTSAFGFSVLGGFGGSSETNNYSGGDGGSSGGAGASQGKRAGKGGSNGAYGSDSDTENGLKGGTPQESTTRAFGDRFGELYSGGGGGSSTNKSNVQLIRNIGLGGAGGGGDGDSSNGTPNTGGGGGAGAYNQAGGNGGSGIVIIRVKQEDSTNLPNPLYLLEYAADFCERITGGWHRITKDDVNNIQDAIVDPNSPTGGIHISSNSGSDMYVTLHTNAGINISGYSTLNISINNINNFGTVDYPIILALNKQKDVISNDYTSAMANHYRGEWINSSSVKSGKNCVLSYNIPDDLSTNDQIFYVQIYFLGAEATISKIWLE